MKARSYISALGVVIVAGLLGMYVSGTSAAAPAPAHPEVSSWHALGQQAEYVGSKDGCRKCHLREYRSWERTPHAEAFDLLSDEEKQDPNCVRCHSTGMGEPGGFTSIDDTPQLAGVGCEVCHGPGSLYMDKEVMESREASVAAGLLLPDESTCRSCHNEESPTFPGEFDYESMKEEGVHAVKR